ncbi:MAG: AraC family transcriptional regulator [Chitinophagaceae bacterium]|nr:AraC family transcriptional regulator [Chitinophagaceae bacterium]
MPSFEFKRLNHFDNIEALSSQDENDYFPFHFHDLFCVSLITRGSEVLKNTEMEFIIPAGSISITQKDEVHRNYSLSERGYNYKTLYVNADVLKHFNNGKEVKGLARVIDDPLLFQKLTALIDEPIFSLTNWEESLRSLATYAEPPAHNNHWSSIFYQIDELIETYPDKVTNTDWLAKKFLMSKFHFIRKFKKAKGVTPQTYIMLYRLGNSKKMLLQQIPLKDIAFENGFYDASHFTNSFKRYFGINPSSYLD